MPALTFHSCWQLTPCTASAPQSSLLLFSQNFLLIPKASWSQAAESCTSLQESLGEGAGAAVPHPSLPCTLQSLGAIQLDLAMESFHSQDAPSHNIYSTRALTPWAPWNQSNLGGFFVLTNTGGWNLRIRKSSKDYSTCTEGEKKVTLYAKLMNIAQNTQLQIEMLVIGYSQILSKYTHFHFCLSSVLFLKVSPSFKFSEST